MLHCKIWKVEIIKNTTEAYIFFTSLILVDSDGVHSQIKNIPLFIDAKDRLDSVTYKRVRHVIEETERTANAAEALKKGAYQEFGKLMVQSHNSLR